MKILLNILFILLFTCCCFGQVNTNIRKDIIPLHSTRSDIEKLAIPAGTVAGEDDYTTENETLSVYFSKEKCVWHGWNVENDTVISYKVYPKTIKKFDFLEADLGKFSLYVDDASFRHYTNVAEGIKYEVNQANLISSITYIPVEIDSNLRCKGVPKYDPISDGYPPFNVYEIKNIPDWDVGLIGSVFGKLRRSKEWTGYIFIYGKKEDKAKLLKLKKKTEYFAYKIEKLTPERIKILFGGYRDEAEVETFIVRDTQPPPMARPKYPLK